MRRRPTAIRTIGVVDLNLIAMDYDIIQKPPRGRSEESEYYVVPVYRGTVDVEQIAEEIAQSCSLTRHDVVATISALSERMAWAMRNGYKVRVDGLGTFRLRLTTPKKDLQATDQVAKHIAVRDVDFRAEQKFESNFANVSFERTDHSRTLRRVETEDVLLGKLREFFANNEFLRRVHVESLAHCGKSTAKTLLVRLTTEGYLTNVGTFRAPVYRATEKLRGE